MNFDEPKQPDRPGYMTDIVLEKMAETFRNKNGQYKDNAVAVGRIMAILHKDGITLSTPEDFEIFHLWALVIVKLTRFANSDLHHIDSIHDAAIYLAMIEDFLSKEDE